MEKTFMNVSSKSPEKILKGMNQILKEFNIKIDVKPTVLNYASYRERENFWTGEIYIRRGIEADICRTYKSNGLDLVIAYYFEKDLVRVSSKGKKRYLFTEYSSKDWKETFKENRNEIKNLKDAINIFISKSRRIKSKCKPL